MRALGPLAEPWGFDMKAPLRKGAIAVAASLALFLSACGGGGDDSGEGSEEAQEGGTVSLFSCTPQNPLIPVATNEVCGGNPIDAMFTGLTKVDSESQDVELAMAKSIKTDDQKHFEITLNDDWTFHDGTPVKAENFVKSWNWGARKENAKLALNAPFFGQLGIKGFDEVAAGDAKKMSGLKVTGDYSFTVDLDRPNSLFNTIVVYSAFYPVPDSFFDDPEAFGKEPVGNGPFKFDSYTPDKSLNISAYDNYAGDKKPHVDAIEWKIYPDPEAGYADVVSGNLDYIDQVPPSAVSGDVWKEDLKGRNLQQPSSVWNGFSFPLYDKKFQDPNLRLAISQAIDRVAVIEAVYGGSNEAATAWTPPPIPGYVEGVCGDACEFKPDDAKEKLKEAGGFDGTLTISYNADGAGNKEATEAVCTSIRKTLDIKCEANRYAQFAQMRDDITAKKMTGMFRSGWQPDYPSAQNYLSPLYKTGASANDAGFSSDEFDSVMEDSLKADPDEATKYYKKAQEILAKEMPVTPLWYNTTRFGWSNDVVEPTVTWKDTIDPLTVGKK